MLRWRRLATREYQNSRRADTFDLRTSRNHFKITAVLRCASAARPRTAGYSSSVPFPCRSRCFRSKTRYYVPSAALVSCCIYVFTRIRFLPRSPQSPVNMVSLGTMPHRVNCRPAPVSPLCHQMFGEFATATGTTREGSCRLRLRPEIVTSAREEQVSEIRSPIRWAAPGSSFTHGLAMNPEMFIGVTRVGALAGGQIASSEFMLEKIAADLQPSG
jgi:hypothetical protein